MTGSSLSELEKARYTLTIEQFLEGGLLVPLFQPIVSLAGEAVYGYEGTIRGPVGSRLQHPLELLAKAGAAGLREQECCRSQIDQFLRLGLPGKLFLNLSAAALLRAHTHERELLEEILYGSGVRPQQLVVELTESIADDNLSALGEVLKSARETGISFALDDFGAAQSNLRMWMEMRPEIVKIDRYFVDGLHTSPAKLEAVKLMLRYSEIFGTLLIAEGIEHTADLAVLKELGIQFGHGYLLGRPSTTPPRPNSVYMTQSGSRSAEAA
jgi:EAL domain-containing protein (putative c-di-GMP-specific phosphodiesterase class I)